MSLQAYLFRKGAGKSDAKRDAAIPLPEGVVSHLDISYGPEGTWNLLDVYYPEGTAEKLPTIVSIHGGGYVYGSKEIYRRYGMDMARRGFAFVNFNYRLAPKWKFPTPLEDTNAVMQWICAHAEDYHLDPDRIILLGDSAGAQLTSHYAAIYADPGFAACFPMELPPVKLRCVGLFCGMYDMKERAKAKRRGIQLDYLGRKLSGDDPRFAVLENIGSNYPPAFLATACNDFLRDAAEPMYKFLRERNVDAERHCYGTPEQKHVAHVFHVNILLPEAIQCNDDAAAFFKRYI